MLRSRMSSFHNIMGKGAKHFSQRIMAWTIRQFLQTFSPVEEAKKIPWKTTSFYLVLNGQIFCANTGSLHYPYELFLPFILSRTKYTNLCLRNLFILDSKADHSLPRNSHESNYKPSGGFNAGREGDGCSKLLSKIQKIASA